MSKLAEFMALAFYTQQFSKQHETYIFLAGLQMPNEKEGSGNYFY